MDVSAQYAGTTQGTSGDRLIRLAADGSTAAYYGQNWLRLATGSAFLGSAQIRNVSGLVPIHTALNIDVFQSAGTTLAVELSNISMSYAGVLRTL